MADEPDYCAQAAALRAAMTTAVTQGRVSQIQFSSGSGSSRMTTRVFATIPQMQAELTRLEGLCAKAQGIEWPKRYAFRTGGM